MTDTPLTDRSEWIRLRFDLRDIPGARKLCAALAAGPATSEERQCAADLLEQRQMWEDAAPLREALGDLPRARDDFRKAQLLLDAARVSELLGDHRDASLVYEDILARHGDSHHSDPKDGSHSERLRARLGLARILRRFGKTEQAVRQLQQARQQEVDLPGFRPVLADIDRDLIVGLHAIGLPGAACHVFARLRKDAPDVPATLDAFLLAQHIEQPAHHAAAGPDAPPVLLERYALLRLLGSGGMGRVYLAQDQLHGVQVAVKLMSPPQGALRPSCPPPDAHQDSYQRFVREARVVQDLSHSAIVRLIEFHETDGLMVLEYMAGGTLADRVHPLPTPFARRVLLQVLDGLRVAHRAGVIHRDIKPQNIFFTLAEEAKLGDFGVAHLQELGATQTAGFIGTLAYMSPEQISGGRLTFAADLYSLGVTAFQMATGRLPFTGPDFVGQHLGEPAPRPSQVLPGLAPAWDDLCLRALAKRPQDRFADLEEVQRSIEALPQHGPTARVPARRASGADEADKGDAGNEKEPASAPGRMRIDGEVSLLHTPHSTLALGNDPGLGRPVIVERFPAGLLPGEAGARHLRWLRVMARHGGPGLQRVLRIDLSLPEAQVVYEAPMGAAVTQKNASDDDHGLTFREEALLRRVLLGLHEDGEVHGDVLTSVVREEARLLLLVSGKGPLSFPEARVPETTPTAADDLAALALLCSERRDHTRR